MTEPSIAIVGSGPAGCYLAQALRKLMPTAELVVIDRLPSPYGLLRSGVAADHQGTKAVSRQFDRLFERDGVHFVGNLEVGGDLPLAQLRSVFDVVVLASGLAHDLTLDIEGSDRPGVLGSGALTRMLNSHPDAELELASGGSHVVVVGAGNVAIDVARLLAKSRADFAGSDIDDQFRDAFAGDVRRVDLLGRSAAVNSKFDLAMLRELGELDGVAVEFHDSPASGAVAVDAESAAKRELLIDLASRPIAHPRVTIAFRFGVRPVRIVGNPRVSGVVVVDETGRESEISANLVVSAIGYGQNPVDPLTLELGVLGASADEHGRLLVGLYCAGWLRTGPRGTIPTHRARAKDLAQVILNDALEREPRGEGGFAALQRLAAKRHIEWSDWKQIDEHERRSAATDRVRQKVRASELMLEIARSASPDADG
ncbi:FAD-dependent oxidoreductase [Leifsonia kafniensis]|uniref:FAD-dependent oxidoreductase n=1 Tax=Leifsonia kafniensis TaxID=475957 RepID=UPI0031EF626C